MFPNKTGVEQNTLVTSYFVSEIDQTLEILGSDYSIYVNNIEYTSGSINLLQGVSVEIRATSPSEANTPVHFVYVLNGVLETFTIVSAPSQESVHIQQFKDLDPYFITQNNDGTTFLPDNSGNRLVLYDEAPSTSQTTIDETNFVERLVEDGDDIFVISHHDYKIYRMRPNGDTVSIINTDGKPYKAVVVNNTNKEIWVTLSNLNKIHILDYYTQSLIGFIDTPSRPTGMDVSSDNSVVAVACETAKQILVLRWNGSTYDQSIVDTFKNPISVAIDDELNVWGVSANSQNLFKISPDNSIQYHQTGQSPRDIKFVSVGDGTVIPEPEPTNNSIGFRYTTDNSNREWVQFDISGGLGTDDFTVEFWIYPTRFVYTGPFFCNPTTSWGLRNNFIGTNGSGDLIYTLSSTGPQITVPGAFSTNTWYHLAVSRQGNFVRVFINGIQVGQIESGIDLTNEMFRIGGDARSDAGLYEGYISNFRLIKGTALYTGNFAKPTSHVTNTGPDTFLLTAVGPEIIDSSQYARTLTTNGTPDILYVSPFSKYSIEFDGAGDYISVPASGELSAWNTDFTIEYWIYPRSFNQLVMWSNSAGGDGYTAGYAYLDRKSVV